VRPNQDAERYFFFSSDIVRDPFLNPPPSSGSPLKSKTEIVSF
jgi:hypothetical protein